MGGVGCREEEFAGKIGSKEILECMQNEILTDDYAAYEMDWLLALEIRRPLNINHKQLNCKVRCWHGMSDDITPLGAAMWMQREMKNFLLYAVEGATHNIFMDFSIVRALLSDINEEVLTLKGKSADKSDAIVHNDNENPDDLQITKSIDDDNEPLASQKNNPWS
jgi:hypothetical protein